MTNIKKTLHVNLARITQIKHSGVVCTSHLHHTYINQTLNIATNYGNTHTHTNIRTYMWSNHSTQQECIPVGCVPPTRNCTATGGGGEGLPDRALPLDRDPLLDRDPTGQSPPWKETPLDRMQPILERPTWCIEEQLLRVI